MVKTVNLGDYITTSFGRGVIGEVAHGGYILIKDGDGKDNPIKYCVDLDLVRENIKCEGNIYHIHPNRGVWHYYKEGDKWVKIQVYTTKTLELESTQDIEEHLKAAIGQEEYEIADELNKILNTE